MTRWGIAGSHRSVGRGSRGFSATWLRIRALAFGATVAMTLIAQTHPQSTLADVDSLASSCSQGNHFDALMNEAMLAGDYLAVNKDGDDAAQSYDTCSKGEVGHSHYVDELKAIAAHVGQGAWDSFTYNPKGPSVDGYALVDKGKAQLRQLIADGNCPADVSAAAKGLIDEVEGRGQS